MSEWNRIDPQELDNHITGHYGEDQFRDEHEQCEHGVNPAECADCRIVALEDRVKVLEAENEQMRKGGMEAQAALSRIDYLCGPPNDMGVSGFDLHCDPAQVVKAVEDRVKVLADAGQALLTKLDAIDKATAGIFQIAAVHGVPYKGPNWVDEYKAMREALSASQPRAGAQEQRTDGRTLILSTNITGPPCEHCHKTMTPQNAHKAPELFLCDDCYAAIEGGNKANEN